MTAQQLERKRASDRESQRARRSRARAYISELEEEVEELRKGTTVTTDVTEQLRRQNKILEEEVVYLRERLAATTTITSRSMPAAIPQFEPWPGISSNTQQSSSQQFRRHSSTQVPTTHGQCSNCLSESNAQWSHINYDSWHPKPPHNTNVGPLSMNHPSGIGRGYGPVSSHIPGPKMSAQPAENSECQPWSINQGVSSSQASAMTSLPFENYSSVHSWTGEASYNL